MSKRKKSTTYGRIHCLLLLAYTGLLEVARGNHSSWYHPTSSMTGHHKSIDCSSNCIYDSVVSSDLLGITTSNQSYEEDIYPFDDCNELYRVRTYGENHIKLGRFYFGDSSNNKDLEMGDSDEGNQEQNIYFTKSIVKWGACFRDGGSRELSVLHFCEDGETTSKSVGDTDTPCSHNIPCNDASLLSVPSGQKIVGWGVYYYDTFAISRYEDWYQIKAFYATQCTPQPTITVSVADIVRYVGDGASSITIGATTNNAALYEPLVYTLLNGDSVVSVNSNAGTIEVAEITSALFLSNIQYSPKTYSLQITTKDGSLTVTETFTGTLHCVPSSISWVTTPNSSTLFTILQDTSIDLNFDISSNICDGYFTEAFVVSPTYSWLTNNHPTSQTLTIASSSLTDVTSGPITFTLSASIPSLPAITAITTTFNVELQHVCKVASITAAGPGSQTVTIFDPAFFVTYTASLNTNCGAISATIVSTSDLSDVVTLDHANLRVQLASDSIADMTVFNPTQTVVIRFASVDWSAFISPVDISFDVTLVNPCLDASTAPINLASLPDANIVITVSNFADSISVTSNSNCGSLVYSLTPTNMAPVVTIDNSVPEIQYYSSSTTDAGLFPPSKTVTMTLVVSYLTYPSISATTSWDVMMVDSCDSATFTKPSISDQVFFLGDLNQQTTQVAFLPWLHSFSNQPSMNCGPIEYSLSLGPSSTLSKPVAQWSSLDQIGHKISFDFQQLGQPVAETLILTGKLTQYPTNFDELPFKLTLYSFECLLETEPDANPNKFEHTVGDDDRNIVMISSILPDANLDSSLELSVERTSSGEPISDITQLFLIDSQPALEISPFASKDTLTTNQPQNELADEYTVAFGISFTDYPDVKLAGCSFDFQLIENIPVLNFTVIPTTEFLEEDQLSSFYFDRLEQPPKLKCFDGFEFDFPQILTREGTNQTMYKLEYKSDSLQHVLEFDEQKKRLSIEADILGQDLAGWHNIELKVIDETGLISSVNLRINVDCPKENSIQNNQGVFTTVPPKPFIEKIDNYGRVWVKFDHKMRLVDNDMASQFLKSHDEETRRFRRLQDEPFNQLIEGNRSKNNDHSFDYINEGFTVIDNIVVPTVQVGISKGDAVIENLDFSWKLINFTSDYMIFDLMFREPSEISSSDEPNYLVIRLNAQLLFADQNSLYIEPDYEMRKKLPRQLNPSIQGVLTEAKAAASAATQSAMVSNVAINIALQGSLNEILSAVSSFQVLAHNTLVNVQVPENASIFYSFLLQIVAFDIFETEDVLDYLFNLTESEPFAQNFEQLGYESSYFTINLGSIFVFMFIWPFLILFAYLCGKKCSSCPKAQKKALNFYEGIFYNGIIGFLDKTYAILLVCCILGIKRVLTGAIPITADFYFAVFFSVIVLLYPIWVGCIFIRGKDKFNKKSYRQKYGYVFADLDLRRKGMIVMFQPLLAAMRLILLSLTICLLEKYPSIQLISLTYLSIGLIIFMGQTEAYKERNENSRHLTDETLILIIVYHLFCSTDLVPDKKNKVLVGWSMIVVTIFILVLRIGGLILKPFFTLGYKVKLICMRRRNISQFKRMKTEVYNQRLHQIKLFEMQKEKHSEIQKQALNQLENDLILESAASFKMESVKDLNSESKLKQTNDVEKPNFDMSDPFNLFRNDEIEQNVQQVPLKPKNTKSVVKSVMPAQNVDLVRVENNLEQNYEQGKNVPLKKTSSVFQFNYQGQEQIKIMTTNSLESPANFETSNKNLLGNPRKSFIIDEALNNDKLHFDVEQSNKIKLKTSAHKADFNQNLESTRSFGNEDFVKLPGIPSQDIVTQNINIHQKRQKFAITGINTPKSANQEDFEVARSQISNEKVGYQGSEEAQQPNGQSKQAFNIAVFDEKKSYFEPTPTDSYYTNHQSAHGNKIRTNQTFSSKVTSNTFQRQKGSIGYNKRSNLRIASKRQTLPENKKSAKIFNIGLPQSDYDFSNNDHFAILPHPGALIPEIQQVPTRQGLQETQYLKDEKSTGLAKTTGMFNIRLAQDIELNN